MAESPIADRLARLVERLGLPPWLYRLADRVRWRLGPQETLIAGLIALTAGLMLYTNCGVSGCPDVGRLAAYQPGGAPVLLDRAGEKFADLAPYERVVVSLDSLPEYVPEAFIAVEDRRFWDHHGVDWVRVMGAALANIRAVGVTQGSSTIPMQLARNVFPKDLPGTERTMKRKLQEARVAREIEQRFEKREILELYLNHIYFGGGAYGIEAAARLYFEKPASELTLAETATLAALPKAPAHYDPRRRPERSLERRNLVLTIMEEQGVIEAGEAEEARGTELEARTSTTRDRSGIPLGAYYIDIVRGLLEDHFGEELYRSRLRIHTTLDQTAQRASEKELEAQLKRLDGRVRDGEGDLQGAVVVMDAHTGDVLALVGGRDPTTSRYNRAVLGRRQIGSAFKPFVFAAALQDGIPTSQLILDAPLRMELSRNDVWEPENYDGRYEGNVSLRHALVRSRNIPTIRLAAAVGIDDVASTARLAGVTATMDETPSLALGTVAMSPVQLASAYTTFATLGRTAQPRYVVRVEDEDGKVLWQTQPVAEQSGLRAGVAYIITDILRDAVDHGTGTGVRSAGFRGPVAGKTGTTNNATDAWFVGYTPETVGVVWIGYDRPSTLGSAATGGGYAAPVFGRIMRQVYTGRAVPEWNMPDGVLEYRIDPYSGLVLEDGCNPNGSYATYELFLSEYVPASDCPYRDWWGDFWNRVGGIFGEDDDDRTRGRNGRGNDDVNREREVERRREEAMRVRERAIEEFMRERAVRLRDEARGRRNNNRRGN
jgi:1A family penicillin-binding protein